MEIISWCNYQFSDENEDVKKINRVANQIKEVPNGIEYGILYENIRSVLKKWINTTFGKPKSEKEQSAYQYFFTELDNLLTKYKEMPNCKLKKAMSNAYYCKKIYRYLGHISSHDIDTSIKVMPRYNNIYVSWSKNKYNEHFESKLKGMITRLNCELKYPYHGIDLSAFGVGIEKEAEIVFPTIEDLIWDVEYWNKEDN